MSKKRLTTFGLEDSLDDRNFIQQVFREEGIEDVALFARSSEMFEKWHEHVFLLLLDYTLPEDNMTAMEIMKNARQLNPDIYVVIVTGQVEQRVIIDFLRAKADDYIDKGTDGSYLDRLKQSILEGYEVVSQRIERREKEAEWVSTLEDMRHRSSEWIKNRKENDGCPS